MTTCLTTWATRTVVLTVTGLVRTRAAELDGDVHLAAQGRFQGHAKITQCAGPSRLVVDVGWRAVTFMGPRWPPPPAGVRPTLAALADLAARIAGEGKNCCAFSLSL